MYPKNEFTPLGQSVWDSAVATAVVDQQTWQLILVPSRFFWVPMTKKTQMQTLPRKAMPHFLKFLTLWFSNSPSSHGPCVYARIYIIICWHILLQQWYVMCSPFLLTRASVSSLRSFSSIALPMGLPMWCTGWATKPSRKTRGPMCAGLGSKPKKNRNQWL